MNALTLGGICRKIERAEKHIDDLQAEVAAFLKTRPYAIGVKHNPDAGEYLHCLVGCADVPDVIPLIIGDAISCLRSALDQLAYRIWELCGRNGSQRKVYFPIFDNRAKYKAGFDGKIQGATTKVRQAFDAMEPYNGGKGQDLWVISALNNTDKHRLLLSAGSYFKQLQIPAGIHPGGVGIIFFRGEISFPVKLGDTFLHTDKEVDVQDYITFQVAFNEPGVIEGKAVLEALHIL